MIAYIIITLLMYIALFKRSYIKSFWFEVLLILVIFYKMLEELTPAICLLWIVFSLVYLYQLHLHRSEVIGENENYKDPVTNNAISLFAIGSIIILTGYFILVLYDGDFRPEMSFLLKIDDDRLFQINMILLLLWTLVRKQRVRAYVS